MLLLFVNARVPVDPQDQGSVSWQMLLHLREEGDLLEGRAIGG